MSNVSEESSSSDEEVTSFAYVDLDGFSEINNEHGHKVGDDVLDRIIDFGDCFVEDDWEFKREYGQGDEFLIVMEGVGKDSAGEHMEKFRAKLEDLEPEGIEVTASIGVASCPRDGEDEEEVVNEADQVMLNAEDWGGNRVVVSGQETPTREIEVWFEEFMRVDEDDLVTIKLWINQGSTIRAAKIYNETKNMDNSSHIAGTFMSVEKHKEPVTGVVSEIEEMSSSETRFKMMAEEKRLQELNFI